MAAKMCLVARLYRHLSRLASARGIIKAYNHVTKSCHRQYALPEQLNGGLCMAYLVRQHPSRYYANLWLAHKMHHHFFQYFYHARM